MEHRGFSVSEAFGVAWELWKKHWQILTGAFLLSVIIPSIPSVLSAFAPEDAAWAQFFFSLANYILGLLVSIGLITVYLKVLRGEDTAISDFFSNYNLLPTYFGTSFLYSIIVALGFILLIIPGIIFGLMFSLYSYFVVDKKLGVIEALKASKSATFGSKWDLFLLMLASLGLNILGLLALGVGLLVTVPITLAAWTWIYLKLSSNVAEQEGRTIV